MRAEVFKDGQGEWRFRFIANNNEPMAPSEGYKRRIDAVDAILTISTQRLEEIVVITYPDGSEGSVSREVVWRERQT